MGFFRRQDALMRPRCISETDSQIIPAGGEGLVANRFATSTASKGEGEA